MGRNGIYSGVYARAHVGPNCLRQSCFPAHEANKRAKKKHIEPTKKDLVRARVTSCPEILLPFVYRFVGRCCLDIVFLFLFRLILSRPCSMCHSIIYFYHSQVNRKRNTANIFSRSLARSQSWPRSFRLFRSLFVTISHFVESQNGKCKSESDKLKAPTTKRMLFFLFCRLRLLTLCFQSECMLGPVLALSLSFPLALCVCFSFKILPLLLSFCLRWLWIQIRQHQHPNDDDDDDDNYKYGNNKYAILTMFILLD